MNLCVQSHTFELVQESASILPSIYLDNNDWQIGSNNDFHLISSGNRLRQNYNGSIEVIPKTPGQVIGEQILRPLVDATFSLASSSFNMIMEGLNIIDNGINRMFQFLPGAQASDIGQITYFEGNCPKGWRKYVHAQGRFILAAGSYNGRSHDGRHESAHYSIGSKGGEINHRTTQNEMPSHTHRFRVNKNGRIADRVLLGNTPNEGPGYSSGGYYHLGISGSSMQPTGGNQPHNNMPPYISLQACQKVNDDGLAQLSNLQTTVLQNKMALQALKVNVDIYQTSSNVHGISVKRLEKDVQTCKGNVTRISSELQQFKQLIQTIINAPSTPAGQTPISPTSMDQITKNKENIASILTTINDLKDQVKDLQSQTKSLKKKLKKLKKDKKAKQLDFRE